MSSNRWSLRAALACVASSLFCASVAAQTAPTFHALLKQTQASAPRLALGAAETRVAEGQAAQAAARPNPTLGLMVENAAGSGPYKDFDSAETTLSIEQPLELGGKRAARISAAQADLAVAQARAALGQVDFARDLALAYANAEAAQQRLAIARDSVDLAQADARAARLLVDNGKEAQVRAVQADAGLATARADLATAQAEAETTLARLSALTGSPETYTAVTGGLLDAAPATPPTGAAFSPAIAAARAERDAAERRIAMERARRVPDLAVSFGVRQFQGDDSTAAVFGISAPLPLFDRNRGAVAAATANAQAAQARLAVAQAEQDGDRRASTAQVAAAGQTLEASRQAENAASEAYRLDRIGYDAGRLPLSELLAARRDLIAARGRVIDTKLARVKALADLARTQGAIPFGDQP
ncbi:transporter [Caulobacter sp. Root1455]|jgi:cobalt-zinc-cadmium efflux system outer membrane protein|uniref:TolC family protein n=1 Tax=unclassified Caulobacter TaxID=2648921 RepID=UPI0006F676F2|nr:MULTISPECIES: TolC family protein [unclassified Caulobacter]KQY32706.1 transporter [Caulobacter sp. Root487D2Y]KQZ00022.1 transporter [Caulobacter sp. Root1455]